MGANTTTWAQTSGGHGAGGVQLPMTKTEWARAMVTMVTGTGKASIGAVSPERPRARMTSKLEAPL